MLMLNLSHLPKLQGRVWKIIEVLGTSPDQSRAHYEYDLDGKRVGLSPSFITVRDQEIGEKVEIEYLPGLRDHYWTTGAISFLYLPTCAATLAETTYSAKGDPKIPNFRNSSGIVISWVAYCSDREGRVIEICQHVRDVALAGIADKSQALTQMDMQENRTTLIYDDERRTVEQKTSIAGVISSHIVQTFNDHGDSILFQPNSDEPFVFEYEYDEVGNWVRKVTHHSGGDFEVWRLITYYP